MLRLKVTKMHSESMNLPVKLRNFRAVK